MGRLNIINVFIRFISEFNTIPTKISTVVLSLTSSSKMIMERQKTKGSEPTEEGKMVNEHLNKNMKIRSLRKCSIGKGAEDR